MSVIDSISNWSGKIFAFLAVIVVGVISFEVIARYGFNRPTIWGNETTTYLCAVYYVIGGAYTLYMRQHVRIDIFTMRLSPRTKAILESLTFPFILIYLGVMIWGGVYFTRSAIQLHEVSNTAWGPPVWPLRLAIPVGAFLLLLQGAANFIRSIKISTARDKTSRGPEPVRD